MKDIGIIAGAGPEAGVLLTKQIIRICQKKYGCKRDSDFPYIGLFSFPFAEMLNQNEDKGLITSQLEGIIQQECVRTHFWVIACNTLHCYLKGIELPHTFVNLLKETSKLVSGLPLVLCSSTSKKYQIHRQYFDCEYPKESIQQEIDELIDELVAHEPTSSESEKLNTIIASQERRQIILGCTEFSLLNHTFPLKGNVIDPMQIVAEKLCSLYFK